MQRQVRQLQTGLRLGEGPIWHAQQGRLLYVDIENCAVTSIKPDGTDAVTLKTSGMVGCVVPMHNGGNGSKHSGGQSNQVLAAVQHSLVELDFTTGTQTVVASYALPSHLRFNDGKCDAQGNLWVGTMAADQTHPAAHCCGSLLCIRNGEIVAQHAGFGIPNGMAWSADGQTFYHIDTATQAIDAYTVGANGRMYEKRTALTIPAQDGAPDGMCIDAADNLWVALWGGGRVACYNPKTQQKLDEIVLANAGEHCSANVSCCTFGGAGYKTLYITTAQDENGNTGGLYAVEQAVQGTHAFLYGGNEP